MISVAAVRRILESHHVQCQLLAKNTACDVILEAGLKAGLVQAGLQIRCQLLAGKIAYDVILEASLKAGRVQAGLDG